MESPDPHQILNFLGHIRLQIQIQSGKPLQTRKPDFNRVPVPFLLQVKKDEGSLSDFIVDDSDEEDDEEEEKPRVNFLAPLCRKVIDPDPVCR